MPEHGSLCAEKAAVWSKALVSSTFGHMRFASLRGTGFLLLTAACWFEACGGSSSNLFDTKGDASSSGGSTGSDASATCASTAECSGRVDGKTICDPLLRQCVQCASGDDCASTNDCIAHVCDPIIPCQDSRACTNNQVCDSAIHRCVECTADGDCNGLRCVGDACRTSCTSDKQCTASGLLCDPALGACVECLNDTQCAGTDVCVAGACVRPGGGGSSGTGGAAGTGGSSSSGGTLGSGGSVGTGGNIGTGGAVGTGGTGSGGSCGSRLDMWLVVDQSGSTNTAYDVGTTWDYEKSGIQTFVSSKTAIGVGMVFAPTPVTNTGCCVNTDCLSGACTAPTIFNGVCLLPGTCAGTLTYCDVPSYVPPAVPLTLLPDTGGVIAAAFGTRTSGGGSPDAAALEGARQNAVASAAGNPSGRTVLVLMADGDPTGCADNTWPPVATVAANALGGTPSIRTYVVTLGYDPATVQGVATAGGTTAIGIPPGLTLAGAASAVTAALTQIASDACGP